MMGKKIVVNGTVFEHPILGERTMFYTEHNLSSLIYYAQMQFGWNVPEKYLGYTVYFIGVHIKTPGDIKIDLNVAGEDVSHVVNATSSENYCICRLSKPLTLDAAAVANHNHIMMTVKTSNVYYGNEAQNYNNKNFITLYQSANVCPGTLGFDLYGYKK